MTGGSLGLRTGSYGSLLSIKNVIAGGGRFLHTKSIGSARKNPIMMLSGSREKERSLPSIWYRCLGRRKVSMLLIVALALLVFVLGSFLVNKESNSPTVTVDQQIGTMSMGHHLNDAHSETSRILGRKDQHKDKKYSAANNANGGDGNRFQVSASKGANHPCANFTFPPPPPPNLRRIGPRPCPAYHRDLLEHMPPPVAVIQRPPALPITNVRLHPLISISGKPPKPLLRSAAVARNLLKNSKSLPQILRGQILGRSNATANLNNIAKDHQHQIVQSLFVSNQKIHAQIPIFDFNEMGSLVGSYGALSLTEKSSGRGHGMGGVVVEARGKVVVDDDVDESFEDEEDDDDDEAFEFNDDDDDDDEEDDDGDDEDGTFDDVKDKIKI
ncbi:hypothetical protein V6N13_141415 [Hibiscus sabdariffa]